MAQVDRLLGLRPGTGRRWIDGYKRAGRSYPPVIREEHIGDDIVTWGEFVEAKLLAAYRDRGVPLVNMRPAVERLRQEFQVQYPLAHVRPYVAGRELVYKIQGAVGLDKVLHMVVAKSGQFVLTPPSELFVRTVEWDEEDDLVTAVRPLGRDNPVNIDPRKQFGSPVVRSVPTEVIAELFRAGDRVSTIADLYELPETHVESALRYEFRAA